MPQLAEQATDPGRMRHDLPCDPTARHSPEDFLQRFRSRPNLLLQLDPACLIQHAVATVAISQIQSDGQSLLRNIPALLRCRGANLLHCRSPLIDLCFQARRYLGSVQHPVGDRPSHLIWLHQLAPSSLLSEMECYTVEVPLHIPPP